MKPDEESPRLEDLSGWASEVLDDGIRHVQPLTGDVSPRRYYRVRTHRSSAIIAHYPSQLIDAFDRFCRSSQILSASGVRVPQILASEPSSGLMLLEDVGDETIFDRRRESWGELLPLLRSSVSVASRIARDVPREEVAALNPPLGAELMMRELSLTWEVFLAPTGLCGAAELERSLRQGLEALCWNLEREGWVPCHRDFMVRNLVPDLDDGVVVLDHQDLRPGPRGYDLASLLNDSLFPPHDLEESLLAEAGVDEPSYHRSAVQRSLKAVGTFVTFAHKGHARYLPLVRPCLERCLRHLGAVPETAPLVSELSQAWRAFC